MTLNQAGEVRQGELGKLVALDSTFTARMLELLNKRGWVQAREGKDRRLRIFSLTPAGREKFQQALPHWKWAQGQVQKALRGKQGLFDLDQDVPLQDLTRKGRRTNAVGERHRRCDLAGPYAQAVGFASTVGAGKAVAVYQGGCRGSCTTSFRTCGSDMRDSTCGGKDISARRSVQWIRIR